MPLYAKIAVPAPLLPLDTLLDYRVPESLVDKVHAGSLVHIPFGRRQAWGMVYGLSKTTTLDAAKIKDIGGVYFESAVFDQQRLQFLMWLSKHYFFPVGEVCECAIPAAIRKGSEKTLKKSAAAVEARVLPSELELNEAQSKAVDDILTEPARPTLLWGITGSGKTEVYLRCIERVLAAGKSALVLVPEIALTPQLTNRFEERFPGHIAVFHSAQKPTQTRAHWLSCLKGERRIAIGPRSALFVPLQSPGILIVDEEHDGSYKQEDRLKYHARDGALALGALYKIPVVLGSATPSAESMWDVERGLSKLCELPARAVRDARPPEIEIVDLKATIGVENRTPLIGNATNPAVAEAAFDNLVKGDFFLSPPLRAALSEVHEKGEQAILFLNRRGMGSQEICRECGDALECPNCAVRLTPHRKLMLCHYCGYEAHTPITCPKCQATPYPFVRIGVGTESIEEALKMHFPKIRTLRMDRDTIKTADEIHDVVDRFRRHEADVLIGTQMVAKGHDFPRVTLVGILLAELGLGVPDFRAGERNYQLMLQVSGRAGRALLPGRVLLQTFQPENPLFMRLRQAGGIEHYREFLDEEIERRHVLNYPPIGRLALLRFDGLDLGAVQDAARLVGRGLNKIKLEGFQVLGPVACPINKIRNRYRWQILLKSTSAGALHKCLTWLMEIWEREKLEKKYRTRVVIDVDPIQML